MHPEGADRANASAVVRWNRGRRAPTRVGYVRFRLADAFCGRLQSGW